MKKIVNQIYYLNLLFFLVSNYCISQHINNELNVNFEQKVADCAQCVHYYHSEYGDVAESHSALVKYVEGQFVQIENGRLFNKEYLKLFYLDSLFIPDSIPLFGFGSAWSDIIEESPNALPIVSFQILKMPEIGDTAIFDFCFIQPVNGKNFSPDVYFSNELQLRNGFLKNRNDLIPFGKLTTKDLGKGLIRASIEVPVTKETIEYNFISLIIPFDSSYVNNIGQGFIAPISLIELNELSNVNGTREEQIEFGFNSLEVDDKIEMQLKKVAFISDLNESSVLLRCSISENSKDNLYSMIRIELIKNKLIEFGVAIDRISLEYTFNKDDSFFDSQIVTAFIW